MSRGSECSQLLDKAAGPYESFINPTSAFSSALVKILPFCASTWLACLFSPSLQRPSPTTQPRSRVFCFKLLHSSCVSKTLPAFSFTFRVGRYPHHYCPGRALHFSYFYLRLKVAVPRWELFVGNTIINHPKFLPLPITLATRWLCWRLAFSSMIQSPTTNTIPLIQIFPPPWTFYLS